MFDSIFATDDAIEHDLTTRFDFFGDSDLAFSRQERDLANTSQVHLDGIEPILPLLTSFSRLYFSISPSLGTLPDEVIFDVIDWCLLRFILCLCVAHRFTTCEVSRII